MQLAVHQAVRRDLARLAGALAPGVSSSPESVRTYWADFASALHHHHELEDKVIWPLMGDRLGGRVDGLLAVNAQEHASMSAAMDGFEATLANFVADPSTARAALSSMTARIAAHLEHEEAEVLPLIPDAFTPDDVAFFQSESAKVDPPARFLPWVLDDADDDVVTFFTSEMPPPVRTLLESSWIPHRRMRLDCITLTGRIGVVAALDEAYAQAEQMLAGLTPDQLGDASRCSGWDVRTTLNHLLGTMQMFTLVNRGASVGEDGGDLVGSDPIAALQQGAAANLATWREPADAAAVMNLSEVVVHTWDVATAVGRGTHINPSAAQMLLDFYSGIALDGYRAHGAFGPEVAIATDAPVADRFLALLGREPV
jgi:uncharacterized protein (TIGR03086 family)